MVYHWFRKPKAIGPYGRTPLQVIPLLVLALAIACGAAATATPVPPKAVAVAPTPVPVPIAAPTPTPAPAGPIEAKVKRLKVALSPQTHDTVLTWRGTTASANLMTRPFAEPLIETDRLTGQYVPGLATSWAMSPDGKSWTFKLRKGVPFHFGWGEFTSKDVPHAIFLVTQEGAIATDTALFRELLGKTSTELYRNVEMPDAYTVVLKTLRPDLDMDLNASSQQGNLFMYSKAQWDAEGLAGYEKKPAGTGPWQFAEHRLGQWVLFQGVKGHWRKTPDFEEFQQHSVPEAATRLAMIVAKEVHISEVDRDLHKQATSKGMKVVNSPLPAAQYFWFFGGVYRKDLADRYDPNVPALNIKVREAINRAVNRKELVQALFGGQGEAYVVTGYHPTLQGWNPRWAEKFGEKYGYDPKRATQLLKEAGYPNGFKVKVLASSLPGSPEMVPAAEIMADYLRKVGIEAEVVQMDWGTWRPYYRDKKTHNWMWQARGAYRPTIKSVQFFYTSGPAGFASACEDKFIDDTYEQIINSVDSVKRDQLLRSIGDYAFDTYCAMPIAWIQAQIVIDPEIVAEYVFPGNINGFYTHMEYVKPVRR